MPAQPADLASQLFDRLTRAADLDVPDEMEIRRLERDAKALMKVNAGKAHQVLGAVAALRWDDQGVRSHHEAALRYRPSPMAYRNYATSLQLVGLFQEAAEMMRTASEKQPENLTWLRAAISFTLWAGHPRKAIELIAELEKRAPAEESVSETLTSLLELMEHQNVSEKDLQSALGVAFHLLRARKRRFAHVKLTIDSDQDAAFFSIELDRPTKEILALDAELGDALAHQMPDLTSSLVVQFEPNISRSPSRVNDGQTARPS